GGADRPSLRRRAAGSGRPGRDARRAALPAPCRSRACRFPGPSSDRSLPAAAGRSPPALEAACSSAGGRPGGWEDGTRSGAPTSGGDCAGLNAVIRAVMLRAVYGHGMELYGIHEATHGLLRRPVTATRLTSDTTRGILHRGGTILGTTNRGNPFAYPV